MDIPPIVIEAVEHRIYERRCSCGVCKVSSFPEHVKSPISYGQNIRTLCGYLSVRQYMSISRIKELFESVFKLSISEGTIINKINTLAQRCNKQYEEIRKEIEQSVCVGTDETGSKVNGKLHWIWTWQSRMATYISVSCNRGFETIANHFPDGLKQCVLVHDCWRAHFKTKVKVHQICLAHILRELNYFIERKNKWAYQMARLIRKSIDLKRKIVENTKVSYEVQIKQIECTLHDILKRAIPEKEKKLIAFKQRLNRYEGYILTFLKVLEVPPDNNFSEQAIRNIKVKDKVSGR